MTPDSTKPPRDDARDRWPWRAKFAAALSLALLANAMLAIRDRKNATRSRQTGPDSARAWKTLKRRDELPAA